MHQRLVCLLLLLPWVHAAQAQPGFRGGVNVATLSTLDWDGAARNAQVAAKLGWQLGAFYQRQLTGRWALAPELQYSYQREEVQVEDNTVSDGSYAGHYVLSLGYLNVLMLARAAFGRAYVEVGPQLGVLMNAHETGTETVGSIAGSITSSVDRPAADRYTRADLALGVGGGVQLPRNWGVSLRVSTGLLSLTNEFAVPYNYGGSLRNQVAQLSLTYQLSKLETNKAP